MSKKPRNPKKSIFADGLWEKIFIEGSMIGILTLFVFMFGSRLYGLEIGRTMAFVSLGLIELVHSFNIKSEQSILNKDIFKNRYLIWAFLGGVIMQVGVVLIPEVAKIFKLTELNIMQWLFTFGISLLPILIMEVQKKFNEIKFGKVNYWNPINYTKSEKYEH